MHCFLGILGPSLLLLLLFSAKVLECSEVETESSELQTPITVKESGIEEVMKFDAVLKFYIEVESNSNVNLNISIDPGVCCLDIDLNDMICGQIMVLRPPVVIELDHDNSIGEAQFMFRNMYVRYRKGNCSFYISDQWNQGNPWKWRMIHIVPFNTFPEVDVFNEEIDTCQGVDQDADRSCIPVDCAIKYEGLRNYYRNTTMKCEEVVDCDTRGEDGITQVAYYDWDNNLCLPLTSVLDDDVQIDEKDVEIPAELDPSQNSKFPNFEPKWIKEMMDSGKYVLKCNHGIQKGLICECYENWMSGGVSKSSLLEFHWCDTRMLDKTSLIMEPKKLPLGVEIFFIIFLSLLNTFLMLTWVYIAFRLVRSALPMSKHKPGGNYEFLEEVVPHK